MENIKHKVAATKFRKLLMDEIDSGKSDKDFTEKFLGIFLELHLIGNAFIDLLEVSNKVPCLRKSEFIESVCIILKASELIRKLESYPAIENSVTKDIKRNSEDLKSKDLPLSMLLRSSVLRNNGVPHGI